MHPTAHVALLRGINVGKAKRIAMADLKDLVASLGYTHVSTLLNSGNVVFGAEGGDPADHAARIHEALFERTGIRSRIVVKTAAQVEAAAAGNPLAADDRNPSRLLLLFAQDADTLEELEVPATRDWAPEGLAIGPQAAYLWCPDSIVDSALGKAVNRLLGDRVTARNQATVDKLLPILARVGI